MRGDSVVSSTIYSLSKAMAACREGEAEMANKRVLEDHHARELLSHQEMHTLSLASLQLSSIVDYLALYCAYRIMHMVLQKQGAFYLSRE